MLEFMFVLSISFLILSSIVEFVEKYDVKWWDWFLLLFDFDIVEVKNNMKVDDIVVFVD